jgi:HrpA-like RNA helicase
MISRNFLKMLDQRKTLPVYSFRTEILDMIRDNRVLIVSGATGSGKSTQIPQFILQDGLDTGRECNVCL